MDAVAEGAKIRVDVLRVTGATLFNEAELVAATGFTPGRDLTLPELRNTAARITRFYNDRGYILAQAYLPAQDVVGGTVTIAVVEGRYGAINLRNQSGVSDARVNRVLGGLDRGDPVAIAPLERRLLLLSDMPGVTVQSTLSPGAEVGTSDLTLDLTRAPRVYGSLEADNAGNRYTGAYRLGVGKLRQPDRPRRSDQFAPARLDRGPGLWPRRLAGAARRRHRRTGLDPYAV